VAIETLFKLNTPPGSDRHPKAKGASDGPKPLPAKARMVSQISNSKQKQKLHPAQLMKESHRVMS